MLTSSKRPETSKRNAVTVLNSGDRFPELVVKIADGDDLELPGALSGNFAVVLFFRGAWCPYCNAQLRSFQRAEQSLAQLGARVVALSVDDEATTAELIRTNGLTFPVGYGADARDLAALTGAFVNEDPTFVQSTGFVFDPQGNVLVSVYSSGAIGRLVPEDVVGMIRYVREQVKD